MIDLETVLLQLGEVPDKEYACSVCGREVAPFAISVTGPEEIETYAGFEEVQELSDPTDPTSFVTVEVPVREHQVGWAICTECLLEAEREVNAIDEEAVLAQQQIDAPWETGLGLEVKAERNRRIESARWAIDPLTSPLSTACQQAFVDYIGVLNRITLDFACPADVVWPTQPELQY